MKEDASLPLLTVVMSFHNGRDALPNSLRSIFWQTHQHWELVLLNDGSTDGAEKVAANIRDSRVTVIDDGARRGLPNRINQGVSLAKGKYIVRMDADDIAFPERFARQVEYLQEHPDVDLLATQALVFDSMERPVGILGMGGTHETICRKPWRGFPMPHPSWMGKTHWFRRHPYEATALKAQDQMLLLSSFAESQFACLPEVLLGYQYSSLSIRKSIEGRWNYVQAASRTLAPATTVRSAFYHTAAALRDITTHVLGLDSFVVNSRTSRADAELCKRWNDLLARLREAR